MNQQPMIFTNAAPKYKLEVGHHRQSLLLLGLISGIGGIALLLLTSGIFRVVAIGLIGVGIVSVILGALLLIVINSRARLNARFKIINAVAWRGDEQVLDIGCGNGFLMLDAAKHLNTGKVIGIDLWQEGSGGQTVRAVWQNAHLEGVSNKVDVQNVDAREMPFETGTFDVIMSSLALHHMGSNADRERAFQEMTRVLKTDGIILLYDMFPMTNQAEAVMRQHGLTHIQHLDGWVMKVITVKR